MQDQEIERKFLCNELARDFIKSLPSEPIFQLYTEIDGKNIRFRKQGKNNFFRTEKEGNGLVRKEIESNITEKEFLNVLNNSNFVSISKKRYFLTEKITFDLYDNDLIVLEVEYRSEKEAEIIPEEVKSFIKKEVTGIKKYSNFSFAKNGLVS